MADNNKQDSARGISGLPRPWATAVQLIGTFGLAVFLVLYYVLVMQPQERARYDKLRDAVESLIHVVEKGQTLLTKDQAKRLESLYVVAVSNELGPVIHGELQKGTSADKLEDVIRRTMLQRIELLEGLAKKGGRSISEPIVHRIAAPNGVGKRVAEEATRQWKDHSLREVSKNLHDLLEFSFAERRMAK